MDNIIEIINLSKRYKTNEILHNISINIHKGEIFGLIGPSGAGKTTLIKLVIGLIQPTNGDVLVMGQNSKKYEKGIYSMFGMVLDKDGLYDRLSCVDNLKIYAILYNIRNSSNEIIKLLEKVGLEENKNKRAADLSKGMRQRLVLARALLHKPQILFLDEPTSGLDPATTLKIHEIMSELKMNGTTIFLTTHNMNEASEMCDNIALLNSGEIMEYGKPELICDKYRKDNMVKVKYKSGKTKKYHINEFAKCIKNGEEVNNISSIHTVEPNLEDIFILLTGKGLD